jgi:hypothetical protein
MTRSILAWLVVGGVVLAVGALLSCGGDGPSSSTTTTTTATTTTTTTLPNSGLHCSPTPPPLYRIRVKVHAHHGPGRWTLDSRPEVINVDGYCEAHTGAGGDYCFAAAEGAEDAVDCDKMAVGQATDTGRWGPTWGYKPDGGSPPQPCQDGANPGCWNHDDNQFLVAAKGVGVYQACAHPSIPLSTDPRYEGVRCGLCQLSSDTDTDCR